MQQETSLILQGGVSATAVAFFQEAVLHMIPYATPAAALLVLDLLYGIRAARFRKEKVRTSTAVRRSITKLFSYVCWLILASTLALAFKVQWLEWGVLGLVYANELASVIGNYLETKDIDFSLVAFLRLLFKKGAGHAGIEVSDDEANEIIKPKEPQPRNARGQFVKREAK